MPDDNVSPEKLLSVFTFWGENRDFWLKKRCYGVIRGFQLPEIVRNFTPTSVQTNDILLKIRYVGIAVLF